MAAAATAATAAAEEPSAPPGPSRMCFFDTRDLSFTVGAKESGGRVQFVVSHVQPGQLAEAQGIESGDVLLGLNSKRLARYGIRNEMGALSALQRLLQTMERPVIVHLNQMDEDKGEEEKEPVKKKGFTFMSDRVARSVDAHNNRMEQKKPKAVWAAYKTADNTTYYFNHETKETQWHLPGSDWQISFDPKNGRPYYYNRSTKETVWEHPVSLAHVEVCMATSPQKK